MAELDEIEFRTVLDDCRARHAAVVALIYATDTQAMSLLRLYVTLGIATGSGAFASFSSCQTVVAPFATLPFACALTATALILLVGILFCLRALRSSVINLPGRSPDFWKWALLPDVDRKTVLSAYLDNLEIKSKNNNELNAKTAGALKWAKRCGAIAPVAALIAGTVAFQFRF